MRRITFMIIPENRGNVRQYVVPGFLPRILIIGGLGLLGFLGFFVADYLNLREIRRSYDHLAAENEGLKGEARLLVSNLEEVKRSLRQVQDYTTKLSDITDLKVKKFSTKTGIGPLTPEEYQTVKLDTKSETATDYVPLGINMDNLVFRPVFDTLSGIGRQANTQSFDMQKLLSTMSQHKSLLTSIPAIKPILAGWITSGFGIRISPFTGEKTLHKGLDIASPPGTPIYAPASGMVIFTGAKEGFGNFIMVAHGYGVVSRYGHLAESMVQPGQRIERGEQIGTVGTSGRTTGPHLHYEVWVNGEAVDPKRFILNLGENFSTL